jgi:hypothetical protein
MCIKLLHMRYSSTWSWDTFVMVSPSPQPQDETDKKLHALQKYTHDFRRWHTTDAKYVSEDLDNEDRGLAIGRLVITWLEGLEL